MRVLVIGPSPLLRGRLVRLVAGLPQADLVVASGNGASYLSRIDPDLVVLEVQGTRAEGLAASLARLRRIAKRHGRPSVVVLTNDVTAQHERRCLEAGADLVLDKSLELELVPALLRSLARRRGAARAPAAHEPARVSR